MFKDTLTPCCDLNAVSTAMVDPVTHPFFSTIKASTAQDHDDLALLERENEAVKPPPRYAVYLLNDDYTPMEFVVAVLQRFFNKNTDESVAIMLKVHTEGRGVCGIYTKDIALTRVDQVMEMAAQFQHPLQCIAEPLDD